MRQVLITDDCRKEIDAFVRSRPVILEKIESFISFRETHADNESFNNKDSFFSPSSPLKGYRHVHLHHGKCILIYRTNIQGIYLYAICDHDAEDNPLPLTRRLKSYTPSDFSPFQIVVDPEMNVGPNTVDHELVEKIRNEVFELTASDPDIIRQSLRGDTTLIEFLSGHATPNQIMAAFGGEEKFNAFLRKTLADYGIREGMRDWMNIILEALEN